MVEGKPLAHWESFAYLGVGVVLAGSAIVVLASNARSTPNRFFAAFLALVAGNFIFDWVGAAFRAPLGPTDLLFDDGWYQLAHLLVPFDAAALLYFAAIFPRRSRLARWLPIPLSAALVAHVAYAIADPVASTRGDPAIARILLFAFFHACYLGALALAVRSLLAAEFPASRRAARALVAALLIAVAPRAGLITVDLTNSRASDVPTFLVRVAITSAVVLATLWAIRRESAPERAKTRPVLAAALVFIGAVIAVWSLTMVTSSPTPLSLLFTLRWVFFAGIVGYALTRDAFLDIDRRMLASSKRGIPFIAGAFAFIALWLVLSRFAGHGSYAWGAGEVLAMGGGILAAVGVATARGVATLPSGLAERKLGAYRALAEAHVEAQRDVHDVELASHARRLGVTRAEHEDIVALVLAEKALRETRGPGGALPKGYRALDVFDAGPTSWTVLAERDAEPRRVVVKTLRPEWRANPRVRESFEREARILARVKHPNVVGVVAMHDEPPTLVLEEARGGSLAHRVARTGPLDAIAVERLARDALAGLAALHAEGVIHRDLKPENILLAEDGRAMIADLGSAREDLTAGSTRVRVTAPGEVGTVLYMAPEQILGRRVDARTDLHALAATLVFAATGRHYLRAEGMSEFEVKRLVIDGARSSPAELGPRVRPLVARALAPDARERPADARAALDMLG